MDRVDVRSHKQAHKNLASLPAFKPMRRGKLPRPFSRMGGETLFTTGLVHVGDDYFACFVYKSGQILSDTHFYGHLLRRVGPDLLAPLFEFHWHPGHKGFHCKTPCDDERDFTNRLLAGARELSMNTQQLDPRDELERAELVAIFCRMCGIGLGWRNEAQGRLWK